METEIKPEVGMAATYQIGSDRYAMEVVSVSKTGKKVGLKSASRPWKEVEYAYRAKDGSYSLEGHGVVYFGRSSEYFAPEF